MNRLKWWNWHKKSGQEPADRAPEGEHTDTPARHGRGRHAKRGTRFSPPRARPRGDDHSGGGFGSGGFGG
ncbi:MULTISPECIES: hypothetical protein [unclassified Streptomyces]|uniref:hypothetical protein n=1 Tax=unclassified Streptomyces TaxID=2593676 RepID=UPI00131EA4A6|nr:hypothetical protein [Streptomyces sp. NRRL F-5135]